MKKTERDEVLKVFQRIQPLYAELNRAESVLEGIRHELSRIGDDVLLLTDKLKSFRNHK
jgi:hypothetical protein